MSRSPVANTNNGSRRITLLADLHIKAARIVYLMTLLNPQTLVQRTEAQVSTAVEGETILLQIESGNYFSLNEVAAFVWQELDQPRTVAHLCERLLSEYDSEPEDCFNDLLALLEMWESEGMIKTV